MGERRDLKGLQFLTSIFLLVQVLLAYGKFFTLVVSYEILIASFLISLIAIVLSSRVTSRSLLTYGNLWIWISLLMIFLVAPAIRILTKTNLPYVFESQDWQTMYPKVNYLAAIASTSVALGCLHKSSIHSRRRLENIAPEEVITSDNNEKISGAASIFLSVICLATYLYWAKSQGSVRTAILGTRESFGTSGISLSNGYLVDSLYGALGICSLWLIQARQRKVKNQMVLILLFLCFLVPSFMQGNRSKYLYFVIVLLIILLNTGLKIKRFHVLMAIVLVPAILISPRIFREQNSVSGSLTSGYNSSAILDTFTGGDTAMAPTLAIMLNHMGKEIPFEYGLSYLNLLGKPIPRAIWSSKAIPFDTQLNSQIFPNTAARGIGFSFSAISEPYVNFGIFGVFIFFYGIGFLMMQLRIRSASGRIKSILIESWLSGFMFILIRGNLTTDIQRCAFPLIIALIALQFKNHSVEVPRLKIEIA